MRSGFALLAVGAFVVALVAPMRAATETVTGRIVDEGCYQKDKVHNKGPDHKMPADVARCAVACATKGRPMALLTKDGRVYTLGGGLAANMNAKLVPHIGHVVTVTGSVVTKEGRMTITSNALILDWNEDS